MATVIDTLFLELGIDASKFSGEAAKAEKQHEKLEKSIAKTEDAEKGATKASKENAEARKKNAAEQKKADEQLQKLGKNIAVVARGFMAFTGMLLGASGLSKLATDAAKANVELDNTAKNLNMSRKELSSWRGVAEMAGGSADGMSGYMQTLSGDIMNLVMMGDASVLPYFNSLGVSLLDSSGKARALDEIMLDLADRMSSMDRQQAYNLARQMGMDDSTANTLMRGRQEMERMLAVQRDIYKSNEADIENARKLTEARAVLNARWEGLKTIIGNALLPVVTYLTEKVSAFIDFMVKNEDLTKGIFAGMASVLGVILIPLLAKAAIAVLGFIAPFLPAILIVAALGTAIGLLYEDYKIWSEGGKSLFDWGKFVGYIKTTNFSVDNLLKAFTYLLTGYTDWSSAAKGLLDWLKMKGFIDETGVSIKSLWTGFKNLASELKDSVMPYLMDFVDVLMQVKDGNFAGAWESMKKSGIRALGSMKDMVVGKIEKQANAIDLITGHEIGTLKNSTPSQTVKTGKPGKGFTPEKAKSIERVARNIGADPNDLAAVISFETVGSFSPSAMHPRSSATGLIQFMRGTDGYKGYYGMSREQFAGLSFDAQMEYVEKYFKARNFNSSKKVDVAELYTAVTGYGYKRGSKAYEQNKVWDSNKDGYISKGEMVRNASFRAHQKNYFPSRINQPIGGAAAANLSANAGRIEAQNQAAKSVNQTVNKHTEVSVNNVTIQTNANSMSGAGNDFGNALTQRLDQYNYAMS